MAGTVYRGDGLFLRRDGRNASCALANHAVTGFKETKSENTFQSHVLMAFASQLLEILTTFLLSSSTIWGPCLR
jgi:hypothetical protein